MTELSNFVFYYGKACKGISVAEKWEKRNLESVFANALLRVEDAEIDWENLFDILNKFPNLIELNGLSLLKVFEVLAKDGENFLLWKERVSELLIGYEMKIYLQNYADNQKVKNALQSVLLSFSS